MAGCFQLYSESRAKTHFYSHKHVKHFNTKNTITSKNQTIQTSVLKPLGRDPPVIIVWAHQDRKHSLTIYPSYIYVTTDSVVFKDCRTNPFRFFNLMNLVWKSPLKKAGFLLIFYFYICFNWATKPSHWTFFHIFIKIYLLQEKTIAVWNQSRQHIHIHCRCIQGCLDRLRLHQHISPDKPRMNSHLGSSSASAGVCHGTEASISPISLIMAAGNQLVFNPRVNKDERHRAANPFRLTPTFNTSDEPAAARGICCSHSTDWYESVELVRLRRYRRH